MNSDMCGVAGMIEAIGRIDGDPDAWLGAAFGGETT
jgi:hypothetical protein